MSLWYKKRVERKITKPFVKQYITQKHGLVRAKGLVNVGIIVGLGR